LEQLKLTPAATESNGEEVAQASGKTIIVRAINIPHHDCSDFQLYYNLIMLGGGIIHRSPIDCSISPYQKDSSFKIFNLPPILVPLGASFYFKLVAPESMKKTKVEAIVTFERTPTSSIFITEMDRENARRIALVNLAKFFHVQNADLISNDILQKSLTDSPDAKKSGILTVMNLYFDAYDEWFNFYMRIRKMEMDSGRNYALSNEERIELSGLIGKRQNALNALQRRFDELQFERFQRQQGLQNVPGIWEQ